MFNDPTAPFASAAEAAGDGVFLSLPIDSADNWEENSEEGQLAVDVLQTNDEVIVVATMAGTKPEDINLHLHNDLVTIRGERRPPPPSAAEYFYQECYWGNFSRTIVLPVDVRSESARAEYWQGVLVIRFSKAKTDNAIPIMVVEE